MATLNSADQLVQNFRKDVGYLRLRHKNALDNVGNNAVARSRVSRKYKDRTFRAINSHFHQVVSDGESANVTFRRADESTFDVELTSSPGTSSLYIGNRMQYTLYVERKGYQVVSQELVYIQEQLPQEIKKIRLR